MGAAKSSAERKRRQREREAMGLLKAFAWPPSDLVEHMIDFGTLTPGQSTDPNQIGRALVEVAMAYAEERLGRKLMSRRDFPPDTLDRMMRL